ncbi:MAG: helix-turn-helix transcriptional regulator [Gordonibacter sp.]
MGTATFPDIICVFSCFVLVCYIVATFFVTTRRQRNVVALAALVCGIASMVAIELPGLLGISLGWVPLAGMLLFSFFFMTCLLLWFEVFSCHDSMLCLVYILLTSALAGMLCWFFIGLEGSRLLCALVIAIACAYATLYKGLRGTAELNSLQSEQRVPARPSVWLLVVTFFFGLGFMYTTGVTSLEAFHNVFDWTNIVYALVLCALALAFSRRIRISLLFYLAAPMVMAGILLTLFRNPLYLSPSVLSNAGLFTYLVFVLVLYCAICREQNSEPLRASCFLILSFYVGLLAGRQLFVAVDQIIGQGADEALANRFHMPLEVAIVVVMVVCTMIGMRIIDEIVSRDLSRPQLAHITAYESSETSTRIATVYKLSDREREVLCLLLENKSATEIAAAMVIAHGTAKTHINNIYKKLDIHTREELFALVPGRFK